MHRDDGVPDGLCVGAGGDPRAKKQTGDDGGLGTRRDTEERMKHLERLARECEEEVRMWGLVFSEGGWRVRPREALEKRVRSIDLNGQGSRRVGFDARRFFTDERDVRSAHRISRNASSQ